MDFVEELPRSEGYNVVLVVVDRLTMYVHFIGMKHLFTATEVAKVFCQGSGEATRISKNQLWREVFRLAGTTLCLSIAYHPQTDGQTEVTNRGMETYLRWFASDKPKGWARFLPWAELSYNSVFHSAIQMSPFKAVYERDPPTLLRYENGSTNNADLEARLLERDEMLKILREHIHKAHQVMKQRVDGHRREVEFEVGEKVFLKIRPYRQQTLAHLANEKL